MKMAVGQEKLAHGCVSTVFQCVAIGQRRLARGRRGAGVGRFAPRARRAVQELELFQIKVLSLEDHDADFSVPKRVVHRLRRSVNQAVVDVIRQHV